jgi:Zn-dependent metalloprotease
MLSGVADSSANANHLRESARRAVDYHKGFVGKREKRFAALTVPRGTRLAAAQAQAQREGIVPDSMLKHIADSDDVDEDTRACAKRDLEHIRTVHLKYQESQEEATIQKTLATVAPPKDTTEKTYRAIYDANHTEDESDLPGRVTRVEGQKASADEDVNKAYDNVGHVLEFYSTIFNWKSIDDKNMHVISSVHFGQNYENAFWDPQIAQMGKCINSE